MRSSFIKLTDDLPVTPLVEKITGSALWKDIEGRQLTVGSPHRYTETIFVKYSKDLTVQACFEDLESINYPANEEFQAELAPLLLEFHEIVSPKEVGRIMITNLKEGGVIDPHVDEGNYADHFQRFHISLRSDVGNLFYSAHDDAHGEFVHMLPGTLYWFDHKRGHWLVNKSSRPRLHLIIDAVPGNMFVSTYIYGN